MREEKTYCCEYCDFKSDKRSVVLEHEAQHFGMNANTKGKADNIRETLSQSKYALSSVRRGSVRYLQLSEYYNKLSLELDNLENQYPLYRDNRPKRL